MRKRLKVTLAHVVGWDQEHRNSSLVRELEMMVDSVCLHLGHQAYCLQFFQDCRLYGLDEAKQYLIRFAESVKEKRGWNEVPIVVMQDIAKVSTKIEQIIKLFN